MLIQLLFKLFLGAITAVFCSATFKQKQTQNALSVFFISKTSDVLS